MEKRQEERPIGTYDDGKGKYQFDYNRLAVLMPKNGNKAETVSIDDDEPLSLQNNSQA